ncbi:unnamed protein product [Ectocarpus sp. 8 AP-2014]
MLPRAGRARTSTMSSYAYNPTNVWQQAVDQNGFLYWINTHTGQATYQLPDSYPNPMMSYQTHLAPMGPAPAEMGLPALHAPVGGPLHAPMGEPTYRKRDTFFSAAQAVAALYVADKATRAFQPIRDKARGKAVRKVITSFGKP